MSVVVAGGEMVLVFVMVRTPILPVTAVAGTPSMNQVISVIGRLKSVMVTDKVRVEPACQHEQKVWDQLCKKRYICYYGDYTDNITELTSLNDDNRRRVHSKTSSCITSVHPVVIGTCY